jgi:hypothetical protein
VFNQTTALKISIPEKFDMIKGIVVETKRPGKKKRHPGKIVASDLQLY